MFLTMKWASVSLIWIPYPAEESISHPSIVNGLSHVPDPPTTPFPAVKFPFPCMYIGSCGVSAETSLGRSRKVHIESIKRTARNTVTPVCLRIFSSTIIPQASSMLIVFVGATVDQCQSSLSRTTGIRLRIGDTRRDQQLGGTRYQWLRHFWDFGLTERPPSRQYPPLPSPNIHIPAEAHQRLRELSDCVEIRQDRIPPLLSAPTSAFKSAAMYEELREGNSIRFHPSSRCIVV